MARPVSTTTSGGRSRRKVAPHEEEGRGEEGRGRGEEGERGGEEGEEGVKAQNPGYRLKQQ